MRIFLAGATGVIGSRLLPLLVAAGHEVAGTTRSPERAGAIGRLGCSPVVVDVYDVEALTADAARLTVPLLNAEPGVVVLTDPVD